MPKPYPHHEPADEYLIRYGVPFVPRLIERARGTLIWDKQGREFLDFTSGQMCATVGHNHPRIVQAIAEACVSSRGPIRKSTIVRGPTT